MRIILTIIILGLIPFSVSAQRTPKLKAGLGMPFISGNESGDLEWHTVKTFPTVAVEKPFPIGPKQKKTFCITSGLAYYFFMEDEMKGTETVGFNYQLYHHTVNGYAKFLFQTKLKRKTEAFVYLGPIGGVHLFSKTIGDQIRYLAGTDQHKLQVKVNENGRDFFNLFYYGAVVGFQPNAKITNFIKPSFEVAYYPGFVTRRDEQTGMIQFSLLIGFYP